MMSMRVLVFGAAGFVGRNLTEQLVKEKFDVVAADVAENPFPSSVEFRQVDVLDRAATFRLVKESDVVIDLAASPLADSVQEPTTNMRVNIEGTLNILDAAREHHVQKVIYSSASSVIGVPKYNPVDEEHPCTPRTPYAVAKKASEDYLRVYGEIYGLPYLIFRFFNVYGPGQTGRSGALIPSLFNTLSQGRTFQVYGDGSAERDFVFVDDVVEFCILAMKGGVSNQLVNLGTGQGTSILQLIDLASELLNLSPKVEHGPERPGEIGNFVADTKRLVSLFGKPPLTPLREGLARTFSWLRSHTEF